MILTQTQRIYLTVTAIMLLILLIVGGFVHRIQQPRIMTSAEMQANGLYLFDTPRDPGNFMLTNHRGLPFTEESLKGGWALVFFGFTYCPDVCPTTLRFLSEFKTLISATEIADTQVVMISVDPDRDSVSQLASYISYFHPDFVGVTGESRNILSVTQRFNSPFRKTMLDDDSYQIDHSSNILLINPMGDFHGFYRPPLDLAKMKVTLRSARFLWEQDYE